jgi:hypothetical protein
MCLDGILLNSYVRLISPDIAIYLRFEYKFYELGSL